MTIGYQHTYVIRMIAYCTIGSVLSTMQKGLRIDAALAACLCGTVPAHTGYESLKQLIGLSNAEADRAEFRLPLRPVDYYFLFNVLSVSAMMQLVRQFMNSSDCVPSP